jgi:hypothetical protein
VTGGCLLAISYLAFGQCARELALRADAPKTAAWLEPIAQASYAFMLYFVLLGSLRFANVDFKFTLALSPIERGEALAALTAIPLLLAKYLLPVGLLLAQGPALDPRALSLLLCKAGAMVAALVGMEIAGDRSLLLFLQLQSQELALYALLYVTLLLVFALRIGQKDLHVPLEARA